MLNNWVNLRFSIMNKLLDLAHSICFMYDNRVFFGFSYKKKQSRKNSENLSQ